MGFTIRALLDWRPERAIYSILRKDQSSQIRLLRWVANSAIPHPEPLALRRMGVNSLSLREEARVNEKSHQACLGTML